MKFYRENDSAAVAKGHVQHWNETLGHALWQPTWSIHIPFNIMGINSI